MFLDDYIRKEYNMRTEPHHFHVDIKTKNLTDLVFCQSLSYKF